MMLWNWYLNFIFKLSNLSRLSNFQDQDDLFSNVLSQTPVVLNVYDLSIDGKPLKSLNKLALKVWESHWFLNFLILIGWIWGISFRSRSLWKRNFLQFWSYVIEHRTKIFCFLDENHISHHTIYYLFFFLHLIVGIFICHPRDAGDFSYRETISYGFTSKTETELKNFLVSIMYEFFSSIFCIFYYGVLYSSYFYSCFLGQLIGRVIGTICFDIIAIIFQIYYCMCLLENQFLLGYENEQKVDDEEAIVETKYSLRLVK